MFRSAAKRLLPPLIQQRGHSSSDPFPVGVINTGPFSTEATSKGPPIRNSNHFNSSTSSSPSTGRTEHEETREDQSRYHRDSFRPKAHWQEEQARVLHASLCHVYVARAKLNSYELIDFLHLCDNMKPSLVRILIRLGWSDGAMIAGAREVGVSPSIVGSFPRKEAALVEFFMDDCLQRLIDVIDKKEDLKKVIPSQQVAKLVRIRLEMQAPYIPKWPQALSIQVQPLNIPTSLKQRAMLVDEIWHAAGDVATDLDWYVKRTILGGIYSVTELYMLTDTSPDFQNTWAFLDGRIKDAFDLKKSVQEAKYLAEAVEAGMGGSLQGFAKRMFQG